MAGAVAFVFGLCALSFAAGCVVTAIMLRASTPEEEAVQPLVEPVASAPQPEQLELRLLDEDFSARPIHRNPVVGLPVPAALEPDPAFAPLPDVVEEMPELRSDSLFDPHLDPAEDDPVVVPEQVALAQTPPAANDEVPFVSEEAARFFLAYAARQGAEPEVLETPADAEPQAVDVDATAISEQPTVLAEPVRAPSSRNGKRREIKLELVPQPPEPEPAPEAEPTPAVEASAPEPEPAVEVTEPEPVAEVSASELALAVEASVTEPASAVEVPMTEPTPAAEGSATGPEPETRFVSWSGLVTEAEPDLASASASDAEAEPEPAPAPEPEPDPTPELAHLEAVVPEQGARPEQVPAQQALVPNDEFRRRYLRTFEAARRRSSH